MYVAISSNNRSDGHVISSPDYDLIPNLNTSLMFMLLKTGNSHELQGEFYSPKTRYSRVRSCIIITSNYLFYHPANWETNSMENCKVLSIKYFYERLSGSRDDPRFIIYLCIYYI